MLNASAARLTKWQPEYDDELARLWALKKSASACGAELSDKFGRIFTRNAVIGRVHRLGLELRGRGSNQHTGPRPSSRRSRRIAKIRLVNPTYVIVPDINDALIPFEQRKNIETIGMFDCRWPVGDPTKPDFFFCGAPKMQATSYCPAHYQRSCSAYNLDTARPQRRPKTHERACKHIFAEAFQRPAFGGNYQTQIIKA